MDQETLLKSIKTLEEEAARLLKIAATLKTFISKPTEDVKQENKALNLECVRQVLASKSRDGFTKEIKNLLNKYGVNKLSDLDSKNYEAIVKEAEGLSNGN